MFDFGNANDQQRQAISTVSGPVLITAGPGTGKTHTLVQRTIYLITECNVQPENIFIATFTDKAAQELTTRITNELAAHQISVNINEMYVGTFHSLCLRILKDHLEFTRLKKNYRLLDAFDQQYMILQNLDRFKDIPGIDAIIPQNSPQNNDWRQAGKICSFVNMLSEELIAPADLIGDPDPEISALGQVLNEYNDIVEEENLLDFSSIQVEAYRLLQNHPDILKEIQSKITHIMVDEYQDTNYIQEQIVFLLGGEKNNICVVGDDDQGLYRFRGATIRNILEFPSKFSPGQCQTISLTVNYRSNSDIVDFYNEWMGTTNGSSFNFDWGNFRYLKKIDPFRKSTIQSPAVVKLASKDDPDEWREKIYEFITELKNAGKISDYNQIAFLFSSVKHPRVTELANFLEDKNINVYSPRSDMFFKRDEIRLALGCLLLMFPRYVVGFENGDYTSLQPEHAHYYTDCITFANDHLAKPEHADLQKWIQHKEQLHDSLTGSLDYAYCGLLYQLFEFQPFSDILDTELNVGVVDVRPARNLAKLTQVISKFEYLHEIDVLDAQTYTERPRIEVNTELLFNLYLCLLYDGGISEYEDDSEYAPSGCVSFFTIHQSKGMEFPIVLVDSLSNFPRSRSNNVMQRVEAKYFHRPAFEPYGDIKYFDFWRLYYTAFSRAQDLLILTCNEDNRTPSKYFRDIYSMLPSVDDPRFDLNAFSFQTVKDVNIKRSFSFTSDITVYETCALQYKFFKELAFTPDRSNAMLFGTLVHETIEDIHRAALRHEEQTITPENIRRWFENNYQTLSKSRRSYLAKQQQDAALEQVRRYVERQNGDWSTIQQAEVDVSLVESDYIIDGKVDLIRGDNNTVEILDFKSQRKPNPVKDRKQIERYRQQLHIYAYLVEERTGKKVSKMHLYYTSEESSIPTISFPYQQTSITNTVASFDTTVQKILRKDFSDRTNNMRTCQNCDFRFYCKNK